MRGLEPSDWQAYAGLGFVAAGAGWVYPPAALIVGGVGLICFALFTE